VTSGENDEEAAWLDLIAHYDAPGDVAGGIPWPERENLGAPDSAPITGTSQVTQSPQAPQVPESPHSPFRAAEPPPAPAHGPEPAQAPMPRAAQPEPAQPKPAPEAHDALDPREDHYIPPPPPPLPKLDPVAKGAWAALFGGPAYLLIATAVGWTVPAAAAFFAIAAFVGGFAVLVLRMGDEPRDGSGPDDGAVV
jgi:hypothetical protein